VQDKGDDETFMIDFEKKIIERIQDEKEREVKEKDEPKEDVSDNR
jgi:hypothetical protein